MPTAEVAVLLPGGLAFLLTKPTRRFKLKLFIKRERNARKSDRNRALANWFAKYWFVERKKENLGVSSTIGVRVQ